MINDEELWGFFRHILHRLNDLEIEVAAMKIALRERYLPNYIQEAKLVEDELKATPAYKEMSQWISKVDPRVPSGSKWNNGASPGCFGNLAA